MHFTELDSPCLLVDPAVVKKNIQEMIRMVGDVDRLRPHIKTHKTAEGIQMMIHAGISKFKCATIAEAELLACNNAKDILLAYQPVGPKIERLYQLTQSYPASKFACVIDHISSAAAIGNYFNQHQSTIEVYIDLNVGMNRTGILANDGAMELIASIHQTPGLHFKGLHAYDGHHRQLDYAEREKACNEGFSQVYDLIDEIKAKGFPSPIIIAGGSPSFSIHCKKPDRECSPGTNIFWDKGYATICSEQDFEPAVKVLTRVISLPAPDRICVDLGHKAIASENEISKRIFFPSHPSLKPVSQSEEHLVLEAGMDHGFKPGDILIGIPYHICPTVALHESLHQVQNEAVTGEWKVAARRRKINL